MKETEIFLKDKENCNENFTHIEDGITDPVLKEIDELYGAADVLSMEHAKTHHWNLWFLSVFGAATAFLFLLYDEAELHLLVFGCIVCIILIYISLEYTERKESHRKYTQYRLLAECLRVQYFLSIAGIKKNVSDILPWFVKAGVPWIKEVLSELIMMRALWNDEYTGQKYDCKPYKWNKNGKEKEMLSLDPEKKYRVAFVNKTRNDEGGKEI